MKRNSSSRVPELAKVLKFGKDANPIFWIDQFRYEDGLSCRLSTAVPGNCCIGRVDVCELLRVCVHHPEDFLNVVGHVLEAFLASSEGNDSACVRSVTSQRIKHMPAGQVVRCGSKVHKQSCSVACDEFVPDLVDFCSEEINSISGQMST